MNAGIWAGPMWEPVLIFNGGEAFTSQPYDVETDEVDDDTIGKPSSGGGVRLVKEDHYLDAREYPLEHPGGGLLNQLIGRNTNGADRSTGPAAPV